MADTTLRFRQYEKVNAAMAGDPKLQKLLSKPSQWIGKHNQTGEHFPKEVVDVTVAIHGAGLDPFALKNHQIVHFATDMLVLGIAPPVVAKPPAPEPPKEKPKAKPEPVAKAPVKPKAVAAKPTAPKPAPKPKRKPKPAAVKAPEPLAEPKREAHTEAEPEPEPETEPAPVNRTAVLDNAHAPAPEPSKRREQVKNNGTIWRPVATFIRRNVPWVPGVVMMNNLYATAALLEPYIATDPESKELYDRLNDLVNLVHSKTVLPNYAEKGTKPG